MSAKRKAVLFLGSGATAGSKIERDGWKLPSDGGFFNSCLVRKRLEANAYPAISLARGVLYGPDCAVAPGLYQTWNDLFVYRGLAQAGVIREETTRINEFDRLANHAWPAMYHWRAEHYRHQFEIISGNQPREYYLAELAIWDLRVLLKDVYGSGITNNVYRQLFGKLKEKLDFAAVANLNYDTTFDEAIDSEEFYHPGDSRPVCHSATPRWALIRPHGSLRWTSRGVWSLYKSNWVGWTESRANTELFGWGYKEAPGDPSALVLHQALVVPPAMFKEEVVGSSSLPGLGSGILRQEWTALEAALRDSDCWLFVGLSLASGDEHLVFLLKRVLETKKGECVFHASCYSGNHVCVQLECLLERPVCCHPIGDGEDITKFLRRGPDSVTAEKCCLEC